MTRYEQGNGITCNGRGYGTVRLRSSEHACDIPITRRLSAFYGTDGLPSSKLKISPGGLQWMIGEGIGYIIERRNLSFYWDFELICVSEAG